MSLPERTFDVRDLLSVTTHIVLSRDRMVGVHAIMDFVTGEALFTHELVAAVDPVTQELVRQHPWLTQIDKPSREVLDSAEATGTWLGEVIATYGEHHTVTQMAPGAYTSRNPMAR